MSCWTPGGWGGGAPGSPPAGSCSTQTPLKSRALTKVPEDYAKFYNHGEGPYQGQFGAVNSVV